AATSCCEPMYTMPFASAGEDSSTGLASPPRSPVHSGLHRLVPQPAASNAYSVPSSEPTYRTPSPTVGVDSIEPPVAPVHTGLHVFLPHPLASNANSV